MADQTISELLNLGKMVERYFDEKLGYTDVHFQDVTLDPSGECHRFYFRLQDDFQKELDFDKRCKCGAQFIEIEGVWDILESWPNREQRELEIMARKLASLDANLDLIESAQVKAFVARLQPQIDEIRSMITDQREVDVDVETAVKADSDDEIPF